MSARQNALIFWIKKQINKNENIINRYIVIADTTGYIIYKSKIIVLPSRKKVIITHVSLLLKCNSVF